jgi:acyl-CoA reductase-like NAD-dependent aldehyde dehydrogenase
MSSETHDEMFIEGGFVPARSAKRIALVNPATEEVLAHVPDGDEQDVDTAVASARRALPGWGETSPSDRARLLDALADGIEARAAEMDSILTQENGAPGYWAAYTGSGGRFLYKNAARLAADHVVEEIRESPAGRSLLVHEPIGVVAAIVPWNSPQVLLASKVGPALAAGCTVVAKPSPETTLDALVLMEIAKEVGFPPGVLNLVSGGRETGAALVRHRGTDMVSFTGSTVAGRAIASVCGEQLKPVSAELGGKSAAVLLEDADLEVFSQSLMTDLIPYSGQVCYMCSRILVHQRRFDEVVELLSASIEAAPVGDPTNPETMVGPLISSLQRDKVESLIASGLDEGARLVLGGGRPEGLERGFYVEPTIFVDVRPEMRIFQEEIFGPVLTIVAFTGDDEAIALENDSTYGLSGTLFGQDLDHANAVARRMETGRISINGGRGASRFSSLRKDSGLGTVGDMDSLATFLQTKNIIQPS